MLRRLPCYVGAKWAQNENQSELWHKDAWRTAAIRKSAGAAGALLMLDAWVPAWARSLRVMSANSPASLEPQVFDLAVQDEGIDIAGGRGRAMTINGTVPGPLLEWHEGRDVTPNVTNYMANDNSIHWHGILRRFKRERFRTPSKRYGYQSL